MAIQTVGDQARAFVLHSQSAKLRNTLQTLTDELSSGYVSDPAARLGGNTTRLHHFETQIAMLTEYKVAGEEASHMAEATQQVLAALHADMSDYSANVLATESATSPTVVPLRATEARSLFASAVARLNTQVAGLHLFSGLNTDHAPLGPAQAMLDELRMVTAGMTTKADVETAIGAWFDAPPGGGGYLDFSYAGTIGEPRLTQIAAERTIAFSTSAASPAIRDLLKGFAMGAIADSDLLATTAADRLGLVQDAGQLLRSAESGMLDEMGRVGLLQDLASRFGAEHAGAIAVAEIGRSNLITADSFQTATALQQVQSQMETLYTLTARLSGLRLTEYLR